MICYWDRNREHATRHGLTEAECEFVLGHASRPYPQSLGAGKFLVRGCTQAGTYIQVIYVHKTAEEIDFEAATFEELSKLESAKGPYAYVIHARPMTFKEKKQIRRRKR